MMKTGMRRPKVGSRVDIGSKVWYKGETSCGPASRWRRWEVIEVLESDSPRPRFLLRGRMFKRGKFDCAEFDYVVVDQVWTNCLPDTLKVEREVLEWNKKADEMEKAEAVIEHLMSKLDVGL